MTSVVQEVLTRPQEVCDKQLALASPEIWISPLDNTVAQARLDEITSRGEHPVILCLEDERTVVYGERCIVLKPGIEVLTFSARFGMQNVEAISYDELASVVSRLNPQKPVKKDKIAETLDAIITKLAKIKVPEELLGMSGGLSHVDTRVVCVDERFERRQRNEDLNITYRSIEALAHDYKEEHIATIGLDNEYVLGYLAAAQTCLSQMAHDVEDEPADQASSGEVTTSEIVLLGVSRYIGDRSNQTPSLADLKPYIAEVEELLKRREPHLGGIGRSRITVLRAKLDAIR